MKIVSKFAALAALAAGSEPQLKALEQAVNFEFSLPHMYLDQMGDSAGLAGKNVHRFASNDARITLPTADQIKGVLSRKWVTPGDTPVLGDIASRVETFYHTNMPELDLGWTNFFQLVDLRSSNQDSFDIIDTNAGITFEQYKPGAKIKIRREISEAKTSVGYLTYGDGIGILDDWLRFQKWWTVEQTVAEFRAKAWDKMAEMHYGLFTALGAGVNQAFTVEDTTTFNAAAASIFRGLRTQGYGLGQNASLWLLCAPEQVGRLMKMLEVRSGSQILAFQANKEPIAYNVAGIVTSTFIPANSTGYYVILPGRKIQRGVWKDLTIESKRDIYARAEDWVGHEQFNAAIGNSAQVRRVLFA